MSTRSRSGGARDKQPDRPRRWRGPSWLALGLGVLVAVLIVAGIVRWGSDARPDLVRVDSPGAAMTERDDAKRAAQAAGEGGPSMPEPSPEPIVDGRISDNGAVGDRPEASSRYCAHCGQQTGLAAPAIERFGEPFCSEPHAEAFVQGVRAARVRAAAARRAAFVGDSGPPPPVMGVGGVVDAGQPAVMEESAAGVEPAGQPGAKVSGWKQYLKLGLCCGAPLLAIIVLAGGGGALLGAAGAVLPLLAFLACPLAMYLMMRGMSRGGQAGHRRDDGGKNREARGP